jgi:hypothetical protein
MTADRISYGFSCTPTKHTVSMLEALPIDSLWVGGHVASTNPTPEAMVELARLSALAERVRIGTAILPLPLYPPAIVAKQISQIDRRDSVTGGCRTCSLLVGTRNPSQQWANSLTKRVASSSISNGWRICS